jgi:hypothetical protein
MQNIGLLFSLFFLAGSTPGQPLNVLFSDAQDKQETPTDQGPEPAKPQAETIKDKAPAAPPRRKAINGLGSLSSVSVLTFPEQEGITYELQATYIFPARVRWRMAPFTPPEPGLKKRGSLKETPEERRARRLQFRCGDGVWTIAPGKTESEAYTGTDKQQTLMQFELRRCAMIWPAELEWKSTPEPSESKRAEIPGLGFIEVELDPASGRPSAMRSQNVQGTTLESLADIQWQEADDKGRVWPKSWQLKVGGTVIWNEAFKKVVAGRSFNDAFFLPFDRRPSHNNRALAPAPLDLIRIPEVAVWRQSLSPEAKKDWKIAIAEARKALAGWQPVFEGSALELDPRPVLYMSSDALPSRLEVRLKSLPDRPPEGWIAQGGYKAMRRIVTGVESIDKKELNRIMASVPSDRHPGTPYGIVQLTESGTGLVQIILPVLYGR